MIDIFINYRTADEAMSAALVDAKLTAAFGEDRVFKDTRNLLPGQPFPADLLRALEQCRVLVVLIGPHWLARDGQGQRRIDSPDDFVRREIERSLQRGIGVIPVRLDGAAQLSAADDLPGSLRQLVEYQAIEIRPRNVDHDFEQLLTAVEHYAGSRKVDLPRSPGGSGAPVITVGGDLTGNLTFGNQSPIIRDRHDHS